MVAATLTREPVRLRRAVLLALVLAVTGALAALGVAVLAPGGWTVTKLLLLGCLAVNAPWLGLSAATGLIGFAIRMLARDPVACVLPQLGLVSPSQPIGLHTAIAVCVRDEAVAPVFAKLAEIAAALDAAGLSDRFTLCVLSDTATEAIAQHEAQATAALRAGYGPQILYRRRVVNTGYKAGNVMSFLDEHADRFELMLCLDADSAMSLPAIARMVRVMQADPLLAILQATFHGQPARTLFPRLFGFGHRHGLRVWATGQAWWQADQGPYWGHNAIVRVAPFRAHCRLDPLPGGALILSHDHVEAARLQAAGWKIRVLASDEGSSESHPPTLPEYLGRDVRWAAGNMQYRYLLGRPDLGPLGRFQMLQAILHYVLTPFWFAMLPLAAVNGALGDAGAVPRAPLAGLLVAGWLTLHGPKLLGYAEALLLPERTGPATPRFLRDVLAELAYTALLDPIIALQKSWAVLCLAMGPRAGWSGQNRDEHTVSWSTAARLFWPHTLAGLVILALFAATSALATIVALPFTLGLVFAIPFAVLTSSVW